MQNYPWRQQRQRPRRNLWDFLFLSFYCRQAVWEEGKKCQQGFWEESKNSGPSLKRQTGQTGCFDSHVSAHWRWNPWLQPGTIRASSSPSISSKHTAHSFPRTSLSPVTFGSFSSSAGDNPFFAAGFTGSGGAWLAAYHNKQMYTTKTALIPAQGRNRAKNIDRSMLVIASFSTAIELIWYDMINNTVWSDWVWSNVWVRGVGEGRREGGGGAQRTP